MAKIPDGKPYIQVSRRVTVVTSIPFDEDNYPGMSLEEALAYERGLDEADKLESFVEQLSGSHSTLAESVSVYYRKEDTV